EGVRYAVDVVDVPDALRPSLVGVLDRVAVVADLDEARALVSARPELSAVTRDGDLIGTAVAAGGSAAAPSLLEVQAAADEAAEQLAAATHAAERLAFELTALEHERHEARQRVDVALARLHESDATLAAIAEELAQHGSAARSASPF